MLKRTFVPDSGSAWFEATDSTVMRWLPDTTSMIASRAEDTASLGDQCALSRGGSPGVFVWVRRVVAPSMNRIY